MVLLAALGYLGDLETLAFLLDVCEEAGEEAEEGAGDISIIVTIPMFQPCLATVSLSLLMVAALATLSM